MSGVKNLGEFNKSLLIFGGVYSNFDALKALREMALVHSIAPDHIICTGDIVAYCGQPFECVEYIREWGVHVLMGNCEESLAHNAEDCGCGFNAGSHCDLLSNQWFNFAKQQLVDDQRQWFSRLPQRLAFTVNDLSISVVHGSAKTMNEFIFPSAEDEKLLEQFEHAGSDIILAGHSGLPFTRRVNDKLWHNSGALGLPANDGTPRTWYSILSPSHTVHDLEQGIYVKTLPLDYNAYHAREVMFNQSMPVDYAQALVSGLWPSMDILPAQERQQQACPISAFETIYQKASCEV